MCIICTILTNRKRCYCVLKCMTFLDTKGYNSYMNESLQMPNDNPMKYMTCTAIIYGIFGSVHDTYIRICSFILAHRMKFMALCNVFFRYILTALQIPFPSSE